MFFWFLREFWFQKSPQLPNNLPHHFVLFWKLLLILQLLLLLLFLPKVFYKVQLAYHLCQHERHSQEPKQDEPYHQLTKEYRICHKFFLLFSLNLKFQYQIFLFLSIEQYLLRLLWHLQFFLKILLHYIYLNLLPNIIFSQISLHYFCSFYTFFIANFWYIIHQIYIKTIGLFCMRNFSRYFQNKKSQNWCIDWIWNW